MYKFIEGSHIGTEITPLLKAEVDLNREEEIAKCSIQIEKKICEIYSKYNLNETPYILSDFLDIIKIKLEGIGMPSKKEIKNDYQELKELQVIMDDLKRTFLYEIGDEGVIDIHLNQTLKKINEIGERMDKRASQCFFSETSEKLKVFNILDNFLSIEAAIGLGAGTIGAGLNLIEKNVAISLVIAGVAGLIGKSIFKSKIPQVEQELSKIEKEMSADGKLQELKKELNYAKDIYLDDLNAEEDDDEDFIPLCDFPTRLEA